MPARRLTRRSLLAAAAGALAGGLARPGAVLALAAGSPEPVLSEQWVGALPAAGRTVELSRSADLLGVEWGAPARARVELRFRGDGGRWSAWVSATGCGGGPYRGSNRPAALDRMIGEPVWSGGTTAVQLRATQGLSDVRLHLIDVSGGFGARRRALAAAALGLGGALPLAAPVLDAGAGQPAILARRGWAQGMAHPRVAPEYGRVRLAFVHHTENPNGYSPGEVPAMLRAIFLFHREVRGWNDIGYNFVIDLYGRVFEARAGGIDEPVVGAQAGGYNLVSTGVAVLGSFISEPISAAAKQALERLLAWKLSLHGLPAQGRVTVQVNPAGASYSRFPANARVSLPRIAGHRDGDTTDCPGDALYGELPAIRPSVGRLARTPTRVTLALGAQAAPSGQGAAGAPAPTPTEGTPPASTSALDGSLALLDGTPISGAPIVVQARSVSRRGEVVRERAIAQAVTDANGIWSLPLTISGSRGAEIWLRALYAGGPGSVAGAAVSDPLQLPAAVLSFPQAPPPTPAAAAPPAT